MVIALVGLATALPSVAMADSAFKTSQGIWRLMDTCSREAQKAYPDYTHQGHLQRGAYREACMRGNDLPYEGGGAVAPPPFAAQMEQPQPQQMQQLLQQMQGAVRH
jgi:hypothetical protein